MSINRLYFLLGIGLTSFVVMMFKQFNEMPEVVNTKTETIVRMVDVPYAPDNYTIQAKEIKSSLNKSKLKHILIYIEALCWEYGVEYEMVKAVIQTESNWDHKAVSSAGAVGLMQILPKTAMSEFQTPKEDLFDPYVNVTVGIKYLSELNKHFDECIPSTLTAYSHGPTITRSYSKNYIKTNFYVKRVYGNM
jgi:soluble lytic murein transglycosylase-like protein|tara:strand:- start:67 stop:642 length:576 start_codon:yes stop_codon:yes gene_type:complete